MTSTWKWWTHLLKHRLEEFSSCSGWLHCTLVVDVANTAPQLWKSRSGHQLPFLVSLMHFAVGSDGSSLPATANATDSKWSKSCSAVRSRDCGNCEIAVFDFLPNLTLKIAACPFRHHQIVLADGWLSTTGRPAINCKCSSAAACSLRCVVLGFLCAFCARAQLVASCHFGLGYPFPWVFCFFARPVSHRDWWRRFCIHRGCMEEA